MNRTPSNFADPGRIAPSVEKQWRDDFIVELRLLSVPGDRIGDALMTVESHVAESGEPAREAFGEGRAYAREIADATGTAGRGGPIGPATVIGIVLGLVGMLVTARAGSSWFDGEPVGVVAGELVGLGVLLLLTSTLFFTRTLRVIIDHHVLAMFIPALLTGVFVGLLLLLSEPLLTVPALPLALAGALALLAGTAVLWFDSPEPTDQITVPGQEPAAGVRSRLASALVMPLMTVFVLVFIWIVHTIAA